MLKHTLFILFVLIFLLILFKAQPSTICIHVSFELVGSLKHLSYYTFPYLVLFPSILLFTLLMLVDIQCRVESPGSRQRDGIIRCILLNDAVIFKFNKETLMND